MNWKSRFSLLTTLLLALFCSAKDMQISFQHVPIADQLPSNAVTRLHHDSNGFMWFGTKDGICRYDGYSVKIIRSNWNNPSRLTNNTIQCIAEDERYLWVGTDKGLNYIDKKTNKVSPYQNDELAKEHINSIIVDKGGNIWVGTSRKGIFKIGKDRVANYRNNPKNPYSLASDFTSQIYQDRQGRIWVSHWKKGLCLYDPANDRFMRLPAIGVENNPFRVFQDRDGLLWVCTWGDGIYSLNPNHIKDKPFTPFKFISDGKPFQIEKIIYSIAQDKKYGNIWVVSYNGLYRLEKKDNSTCILHRTESIFEKVSNNIFHDIISDRRGNLWIGSEGEGVYRLDFNSSLIKNYPLLNVQKQIGYHPNITNLCETADRKVFMVVDRSGLYVFDPKSGDAKTYQNPEIQRNKSICSITWMKGLKQIWICNEGQSKIYAISENSQNTVPPTIINLDSNAGEATTQNILEDSRNVIWIGMINGVYYKLPNSSFRKFNRPFTNPSFIKEDKKGNVWITCEEGIFRIAKNTYKAVEVQLDSHEGLTIKPNSIKSFIIKKDGDLCFGTSEGNIILYNDSSKKVEDVSMQYGITEESVLDIIEDTQGLLWISTTKKIIRYNPTTHAASYYTAADGITVDAFSNDASILLSNGLLLFGGNKGIAGFNPRCFLSSSYAKNQQIAITDIIIQNRSIFDNNNDEHYDPTNNRVTIHSSENNFGVEFSSLDFSASSKIQYAYMLDGIDKGWTYVSNNRRTVNYANLPSGSYTFKVKASDINGGWNQKEASISIVIKPPFYKSWWAYLLYFLIVSAAVSITLRNIANKIKLQNELRISSIEKEKSEELAQIKLGYFTNISHELLTPLTIISLLIENLERKYASEGKQLVMMKANVNRLKRLIQQILAFKKTESGTMRLKIQKTDVVAFVNNICESNFNPLAADKEISFIVDSEFESYIAYFDLDKLDKILYNLLSNSFKHTPKGGEIRVKMSFFQRDQGTTLSLSVSDTGNGIAEHDLPNIFKRFYVSSSSDQSQSHGIGLSLTQDLIQIHHGTVRVNSSIGEGAVFTVELPISKSAYSKEELSDEEATPYLLAPEVAPVAELSSESYMEDEKDFTILVAEDNKELNRMITDYFAESYKVISAENGVVALNLVRENDVDLIISDVMMPEMDGLSLCQIIKNDITTSHISMLMLTAKNTAEDRIDCYNAGADAYIAKPFEMKVLEARAKNLIAKRRQKSQSFQKNVEVNIPEMGYSSIDQEFLRQAVLKVEAKLSDIMFDFEHFAADMGTSKSTLHRKLKSLTGMSPGEFIRNVRLKHAAKLLLCNAGNVSEIAYTVGFNDSKYFSRSFKAEFGLTPTEYRDNQKEKE